MPQPAAVEASNQRVLELFQRAQRNLEAEQARILALAPVERRNWFRREARLGELTETITGEMSGLLDGFGTWATTDFPDLYQLGTDAVPLSSFTWSQVHLGAVQQIADDTYLDVLAATQYVEQDTKRWVRDMGDRTVSGAIIEGRTAEQAARDLAAMGPKALNDLGDPMPITSIIYRDGSTRTLDDYADMLIRTKTAVAYNAGTINFAVEQGVTRFEVFDGSDCSWPEGHGKGNANGKIVSAKQAATYPIAHPRCRRAFGARPDLDPTDTDSLLDLGTSSPDYDPSTTVGQRIAQRFAEEARQAAFNSANQAARNAAARNARRAASSFTDDVATGASLFRDPITGGPLALESPKLVEDAATRLARILEEIAEEKAAYERAINSRRANRARSINKFADNADVQELLRHEGITLDQFVDFVPEAKAVRADLKQALAEASRNIIAESPADTLKSPYLWSTNNKRLGLVKNRNTDWVGDLEGTNVLRRLEDSGRLTRTSLNTEDTLLDGYRDGANLFDGDDTSEAVHFWIREMLQADAAEQFAVRGRNQLANSYGIDFNEVLARTSTNFDSLDGFDANILARSDNEAAAHMARTVLDRIDEYAARGDFIPDFTDEVYEGYGQALANARPVTQMELDEWMVELEQLQVNVYESRWRIANNQASTFDVLLTDRLDQLVPPTIIDYDAALTYKPADLFYRIRAVTDSDADFARLVEFEGIADPKRIDTSLAYWTKPNGELKTVRQELHATITADIIDATEALDIPGELRIVGGAPSTGKTSLIDDLDLLDNATVRGDTTELAERLPEFARLADDGDDLAAAFVHAEADQLRGTLTADALANNRNALIETSTPLTSNSALFEQIETAKAAGTRTVGRFTTADLDTTIARAAATDGPIDDLIRASHADNVDQLTNIIGTDLFDDLQIFDTTTGTPQLVISQIDGTIDIPDIERLQRWLNDGDYKFTVEEFAADIDFDLTSIATTTTNRRILEPIDIDPQTANRRQTRLELLDDDIAEDIQETIDDKLRLRNDLEQYGGIDVDKILDDTKEFFADTDTTVNVAVSSRRLEEILADGRLKSQFETGTSGGSTNLELRKSAERNLLNYPKSNPPENRPIYGWVGTADNVPAGIENYGDVQLVFRNEIKNATTVTGGDSLGDIDALAAPLLDIKPETYPWRQADDWITGFLEGTGDVSQFADEANATNLTRLFDEAQRPVAGYWEAQIHGGNATIDNVTSAVITVFRGVDNVDIEIVRLLDEAGIPWRIAPQYGQTFDVIDAASDAGRALSTIASNPVATARHQYDRLLNIYLDESTALRYAREEGVDISLLDIVPSPFTPASTRADSFRLHFADVEDDLVNLAVKGAADASEANRIANAFRRLVISEVDALVSDVDGASEVFVAAMERLGRIDLKFTKFDANTRQSVGGSFNELGDLLDLDADDAASRILTLEMGEYDIAYRRQYLADLDEYQRNLDEVMAGRPTAAEIDAATSQRPVFEPPSTLADPTDVAGTLIHELTHALDYGTGSQMTQDIEETGVFQIVAELADDPIVGRQFAYAATEPAEAVPEITRMYFTGLNTKVDATLGPRLGPQQWRDQYPELAQWVEANVLDGANKYP